MAFLCIYFWFTNNSLSTIGDYFMRNGSVYVDMKYVHITAEEQIYNAPGYTIHMYISSLCCE